MHKRFQFIIILLLSLPFLSAAESCGDSTVVSNVWITEVIENDFNSDPDLDIKSLKSRTKSLMIQEDETHPCDTTDAFYLKPGKKYEIEFMPADWESANPAYHIWTLKIDFDNSMDFHNLEIFEIEGSGIQKLIIDVPTYLRLKRTWVEFEMKKDLPSCGSDYCGMDAAGEYCILFRKGIAVDAGAICFPDISCIPFDNITQYESIDSVRVNNVTIDLCMENTQEGYCSNFVNVLPMYGDDELTVYVGYDGFTFEETVTVWFDSNYDGSYIDEAIAGVGKGSGQINLTVNKPNFQGYYVFFTMRVKLENGSISTGPCDVVEGEVRDYIVLYNLYD